ncbi:MAG: alpha/beta fold hydrolase, partial [Proteobacteria bacterium]|nr:alpha/beta fold hydrolase [Pseudomonadota bacterium]
MTGRSDFRARLPWLGGDLQTVRNLLLRIDPDLSAWPGERLLLPLADGDRLWASLHRPNVPRGRPLAVLIHGLSGSQESIHVRATARCLLERGFPVARLNLRGAGPSVATCRGLYHAAATGDLAEALDAIPADLARDGIVAVGFSLGANLLLRMLGEQGPRTPLRAAVAVSAPVDVAATSVRFHRLRNRLYMRWLLGELKSEVRMPGRVLSNEERAVIDAVESIYDLDDRFVAPRHGFTGAPEYYARASSLPLLTDIAVPTLVIHALDDPWIDDTAYRAFDWRRARAIRP